MSTLGERFRRAQTTAAKLSSPSTASGPRALPAPRQLLALPAPGGIQRSRSRDLGGRFRGTTPAPAPDPTGPDGGPQATASLWAASLLPGGMRDPVRPLPVGRRNHVDDSSLVRDFLDDPWGRRRPW